MAEISGEIKMENNKATERLKEIEKEINSFQNNIRFKYKKGIGKAEYKNKLLAEKQGILLGIEETKKEYEQKIKELGELYKDSIPLDVYEKLRVCRNEHISKKEHKIRLAEEKSYSDSVIEGLKQQIKQQQIKQFQANEQQLLQQKGKATKKQIKGIIEKHNKELLEKLKGKEQDVRIKINNEFYDYVLWQDIEEVLK